MFKVAILCVGKNKDEYVQLGISEFEKRLSQFCDFEIIYVPDASGTPEKVIEKESDSILSVLKRYSGYEVIALDLGGKAFSSEEFAVKIGEYKDDGAKLLFVIGGAYGFSNHVRGISNLRLSMSTMTLTHQMIRIFLLEQIYRAFTILTHKEYHH